MNLRLQIPAIAAAALIGAAVSAFAGEPSEPDESCGVSTPEMVACLNDRTAFWDERLNAAYAKALKTAEAKQAASLRKAQRLWIQYRDANCGYYAAGEGSISRINAAACMRDMTKARANELANNLNPN